MKTRLLPRVWLLTLSWELAALPVTASAAPATVRVDQTRKYQTIEGFGFFGARDAWWGSPAELTDPEWVRLVIDDLGLTMWRNEYYPPADAQHSQDADLNKQRPVLEALRDRAKSSGVALKVILTVWSAPAHMKCASDRDAVHEGTPHPGGTKDGGAVCPSKRQRFAEWLIDGLQLYALSGVNVYALSFQNEPLFRQSYNSSRYPQAAYAETLESIGPILHARFPALKLFGPETLLDTEVGKNDGEFDPYWYTAQLLSRPRALAQLGAFAVHAYTPSMLPTAASKAARLWTNFQAAVAPSRRPIWMTETSGYVDAWEGGKNAKGEERPGAFDLAQAIFAALYYGKASAWLWWQGSERGAASELSLMQGTNVGQRYYASKHFYRFVRPGARMLASTSDDPKLLAIAFAHDAPAHGAPAHGQSGSFVSVLINGAKSEKLVRLVGAGVPPELDAYVTSANTKLWAKPTRVARDAIVLPPRSIMTLVSGSYLDQPGPRVGGAGGRTLTPPPQIRKIN